MRDPWPLVLVAVGLALRLAPWRAVFRGGQVFFIDPDDYYHLRRMMTAAADFPRLPSFDAYLGFPSGFHCNWPPLYDWSVGLLTLIAGLGHPGLRLSQTVAAFVPPIAGAATLWLFYRVASRILERRAALWALAIAAALPMPAFYTALGRPDHHCVENLWFLLALLPILFVLERSDKEPSRWSILWTAALLAAGVLSWIGSVMFSAILSLFGISEFVSRRGPSRTLLWLGAVQIGRAHV